MEMSDLRTFLAVMDSGSISQAAKALHRVPSGITARIMQMEEELGVQLFLREKKAAAAHRQRANALHLCPQNLRLDG